MSRTVVVVCHRAAPSECSWPSRRATRTDPGSGSDWRSAGAASKQTMELSACATYPAQAVFSLSTFRGAHWLSAASSSSWGFRGVLGRGSWNASMSGVALLVANTPPTICGEHLPSAARCPDTQKGTPQRRQGSMPWLTGSARGGCDTALPRRPRINARSSHCGRSDLMLRRITSAPKPCRFAQLRTNIGGCQGMQVPANCGALLQPGEFLSEQTADFLQGSVASFRDGTDRVLLPRRITAMHWNGNHVNTYREKRRLMIPNTR